MSTKMELLQKCVELGSTEDGVSAFQSMKYVFTDQKYMYIGTSSTRVSLDDPVDFDSLKTVRIAPEAIFPVFDPQIHSTASIEQMQRGYLKRPGLLMEDENLFAEGEESSEAVRDLILREVAFYEVLKENPHPNLVKYYGCRVADSRITALCLENHPQSLRDRLLQNEMPFDKERYLTGIRNGVEHMHKLGFCHNDLNPGNIMITADEQAVIIDFDSTVRVHEKLTLKSGGPQYCNIKAMTAEFVDDWYSFRKIALELDQHVSSC